MQRGQAEARACDLGNITACALQLLRQPLVHGIQIARTLHCSGHDAGDQCFALLVLRSDLTST